MCINMNLKVISLVSILSSTTNALASGIEDVRKNLIDALVCKAKSAETVYDLVQKGSNFKLGYAAYGFGEGTGYKAVVMLNEPLTLYGATAFAIVAETENSYFDFSAFTYGKFKGDFKQAVKALNLQPASPFTEKSLGKFVSEQPVNSKCPETIALTPIENGYFLLGCGWCNGG